MDIMNADLIYLESFLNVEELLPLTVIHNYKQITSNTMEENICDILKETNFNEESKINTVNATIHEKYVQNTLFVLNPPLSASEINAIDVDEIVINEISGKKKRKINPKIYNT